MHYHFFGDSLFFSVCMLVGIKIVYPQNTRMNIEEIMKIASLNVSLELRFIRMHGQEEIYHQNRIM